MNQMQTRAPYTVEVCQVQGFENSIDILIFKRSAIMQTSHDSV